jgi:hypothetical protein
MTNERFFRLLSIAILGGAALAFVPDIKADESQQAAIISSMPELATLTEVEQINNGTYQPWIRETGDSGSLDVSALDPQEFAR